MSGGAMARLGVPCAVSLAALLVAGMATAAPPAQTLGGTVLSLDGGSVVVRGAVRSSIDGTVFDALTQQHGAAGAHPGGLYDLSAGGLKVVEQDLGRHAYTLAGDGSVGPACAAARVASPCLVPRTTSLAHERLVSGSAWLESLSGDLSVDVAPAAVPAEPLLSKEASTSLARFGSVTLAGLFALVFGAILRARRRSPLGQVRAAAREARRVTKRDRSLSAARAQIDELVTRANRLDAARAACAAKLSTMDVAAMERKRAAWASSGEADAKEALSWLTEEAAEAARLRADLASSVAGLERVAAALRVLSLRAREHRGTRARVAAEDPVDALAEELSLRDDALVEADRAAIR